MLGALKSDWIKFQHTWILALVFLGPIGVVSLTGVHYAVSYHEMVQPGVNDWAALVQNINFLLIPALILGLTLLASLMTGIEHQGHTWKQLLALPVPRLKIYCSKFIWLLLYLVVSSALAFIGTIIDGYLIGFAHQPIPWHAVFQEGFAPYLASYALIAFQMLLSVLIANQSFAISAGIIGVIVSFANVIAHVVPKWVPWVYPGGAAAYSSSASQAIVLSMVVCFLLFCVGIYFFSKHQVK